MPTSGDVDMTTSGTTSMGGPITINSIRFSAGDAQTTLTGNTLTVSSGGILETAAVGANAVTISANVTTTGGQLTVNQFNTAAAMSMPSIAANGAFALVKSGPGMLILGPGTQSWSGGTYVNGGTLELVQQSAINSTILPVEQPVTINSGGMVLATFTNEFGQGSKPHNDPSLGAPSVINLNGGTLNVVANKDNGIPAVTFLNGGLVTSQGPPDGATNFYFRDTVTVNASNVESVINAAGVAFFGDFSGGVVNFNVTRGTAPVDLLVSSYLGNNFAGINGTMGKSGNGIVLLTGDSSNGFYAFGSSSLTQAGNLNGALPVSGGSLLLGYGSSPTTTSGGTTTTFANTYGRLGLPTISVSPGATFGAMPGVTSTSNVGTGTSLAIASSANYIGINAGVTAATSTLTLQAGTSGLGSGATFTMAGDGATSLFTVGNTNAATSALVVAGNDVLNFDVGGVTTATDELLVFGGAKASVAGVNTINLTFLPGTTSLTPGSYNLIAAASGLNGGTFQFTNGTALQSTVVGGTTYQLALLGSNAAEQLAISVLGSSVYNWNLTNGGTWSNGNSWNPNTNFPHVAGDAAVFGPSMPSGAAPVTLDGNVTITSLTLNTANSVTITAGTPTTSSLTFDATPFGATTPAALLATGGSHAINVPIVLNSPLGINLASGASLGIGGIISGGSTQSLTLSGGGTLTLSAANTYTGATSVSGGLLKLISGGSLGNTAISVSSGATFAARSGVSGVGGNLTAGLTSAAGLGATMTLNSGAVFDMVDGATNTFKLQQEGTFAGTALTISGATFNFELGASSADQLAMNGPGIASVSGTNTISLTTLASSLTSGIYPLISAPSGMTGTFQFAAGGTTQSLKLNGIPYQLSLVNSATAESLQINLAGVWNNAGGSANWNTAANWVNGLVPQTSGDTATFGPSRPTSAANITLDISPAIGALVINNANSLIFTQGASNTFTFANGSSAAVLVDVGGINGPSSAVGLTINAPVAINNATTIGLAGNTAVTLSAGLSGAAANSLTLVATPVAVGAAGGPGFAGALGSAPATLTLSGATTYSGSTTIVGGSLITTGSGNISSGALTLGSGSLSLANGQTVNGLTVGVGSAATGFGGGSEFTVATGTMTLGAIAQATSSLGAVTVKPGTVDFSSSGTFSTITANTATSILGGWAIFGGNTWAVSAGTGSIAGNLSGLASGSYSANTATSMTASANIDMTVTGTTNLAAITTINSLRFNNAGPVAINGSVLPNPPSNLSVASGGILETSAVGANAVVFAAGNSFTLTTASTQLYVDQYNTAGTMTISALGAAGYALVKSGPGTLILNNAAAFTYTGGTFVNQGTLQIQSNTANLSVLPATTTRPVVINSGATLLATSANAFGTTAAAAPSVIDFNGGSLLAAPSVSESIPVTTFINGGLLSAQGPTEQLGLLIDGNLTVNASAAEAVVNATNISLRGYTGAALTFNVARGTSPVDLLVSSYMGKGGAATGTASLTKSGTGTMLVTGDSSNGYHYFGSGPVFGRSTTATQLGTLNYAGTTSVTAGSLLLGYGLSPTNPNGGMSVTYQNTYGRWGNATVSVSAGATFGAVPGVSSISNVSNTTTAIANSANYIGFSANDAVNGGLSTLTLAAGVSAGAGGVFNMSGDNATSLFTIDHTAATAGLTLNNNDVLNFDLGSAATDELLVFGGGTASVTATSTINISLLPGITTLATASPGYTLIAAASGLNTVNGFKFANGTTTQTLSVNGVSYQLSLVNSASAEQLAVSLAGTINTYTSTLTAGGSWSSNGSWTSGTNFPHVAGDAAVFGAAAAGPITLDGNVSVTNVTFNNTAAITITAGMPSNSALTLDATTFGTAAPAALTVTAGSQAINVPVALASPTGIYVASGSSLGIGGAISGGSAQSLTLLGGGTLTLTGASTYTGATNVAGGTLRLGSGSGLAATAISIGNNTTLQARSGVSGAGGSINVGATGAGSAGGTLSLASGSTFDMVDNATNTFTLQQQGSFAGTALSVSNATFNFELGGSTADKLAAGGAASVGGTNTINLTTIASSLTPGKYTLISAASGLAGAYQFASGVTTQSITLNGVPYQLTLGNTATGVTVGVNDVFSTWKAAGAGNWSTSGNWLGGVPQIAGDTATFGPSNPAGTAIATLDINVSLGALTFNNVQSITIAQGASNTLTLDSNGSTSASLIDLGGIQGLSTLGTHAISAPLVLNSPTNIALAGNSALAISGGISGAAANGLTLSAIPINIGSGGGAGFTGTLGTTPATLTLSGATTYSGPTTIAGGSLIVNSGSNISTAALTMGSGSLSLAGSQTVGALTVGITTAGYAYGGGGSISISAGTLALGAIAQNAGGAVDFASTGGATIMTSSSNMAGAILGGWATFNGATSTATWATVSGGAIGGLATYSSNTASSMPFGTDVDMTTTGTTTLSAITTINSLRFNNPAVATVTGSVLSIASGGILETSNVGNNAVTISSTLTTSGRQLIVNQYNTANTMTINTVNAPNAAFALVKTGPGTLVMNTNTAFTFTGGAYVDQGILKIQNGGSNQGTVLPAARPVVVNSGATLLVGTFNALGLSAVASPSLIDFNGGTLNETSVANSVGGGNDNALPAVQFSNGGLITAQGPGDAADNFHFDGSVTVNASPNEAVIDAQTTAVRGNYTTGTIVNFNVARGTAPVDLLISSYVGQFGTPSVTKTGSGIMLLTGDSSNGYYANGCASKVALG